MSHRLSYGGAFVWLYRLWWDGVLVWDFGMRRWWWDGGISGWCGRFGLAGGDKILHLEQFCR